MSSLSKIVVLATKPKRAAPKAKYIDPIVQGTFNQDGSIQDIVKTLSTRLRDDNTTVVFKSLIVLHTLLRAGSLEPTFSYLSTSSISLSLGSHEAPNISAYAAFLAARIKSYTNLKRDVIRDKSDRRAASRLRTLGVDGGLLREVREVQRMIASLVESKFYSDDIDDDVSMTALRLLVKDLLVLFQAVNEGVINVLEHYFEMSHVDATTALKIYKTFCRDTEKVVLYLGVAKKLQNVLNVPIPNLKHAPVSLVGSLEEYLNDPNFATNREEYKENKRIADGGAPNPAKVNATASTSKPVPSSAPTTSTTATNNATAKPQPSFMDFFDSIEESQTTMFHPTNESSNVQYFQQQATYNPFLQQQVPYQQQQQQMMIPQMTGMGYNAFGPGVGAGMSNPFGQLQQQPQQFLQQQPTGFIQPQMTGINPFRQNSMPLMNSTPFSQPLPLQNQFIQSQPTGAFAPSPFVPQQSSSPFTLSPQATGAFGNNSPFGQIQSQPQQPLSSLPLQFQPQRQNSSPFPSPINTSSSSSPFAPTLNTVPQALVGQKTGARNPFNPAPGEVVNHLPKSPVGPSMNSMASNAFGLQSQQSQQSQQQQSPIQTQAQTPFSNSTFNSNSNSNLNSSNNGTNNNQISSVGGLMGSIASDFTFSSNNNNNNDNNRSTSPTSYISSPPSTNTNTTSAPISNNSTFSSFNNNNNNNFSQNQSQNQSGATPLFSQPTGYSGSNIKPFQPTSSFGSALQDEFSSSNSFSSSNNNSNNNTSFSNNNNNNNQNQTNFNSQPQQGQNQQQQQGQGQIQPQSTGFNPFRGSTLPPLNSPLSGGGGNSNNAFGSQQQNSGSLI